MRFFFSTITRPKHVAKQIHGLLPQYKLSAIQELSAKLYGYKDWYELHKVTLNHQQLPSSYDEDASIDVVNRRRADEEQLLEKLMLNGLLDENAITILKSLKLTAKDIKPQS
jgi:hypothetical protein